MAIFGLVQMIDNKINGVRSNKQNKKLEAEYEELKKNAAIYRIVAHYNWFGEHDIIRSAPIPHSTYPYSGVDGLSENRARENMAYWRYFIAADGSQMSMSNIIKWELEEVK
jgi:hypothetical protein